MTMIKNETGLSESIKEETIEEEAPMPIQSQNSNFPQYANDMQSNDQGSAKSGPYFGNEFPGNKFFIPYGVQQQPRMMDQGQSDQVIQKSGEEKRNMMQNYAQQVYYEMWRRRMINFANMRQTQQEK